MFHHNSQPAPNEESLDELLLSSRIKILRLIQTLIPHDVTTAVDDKRLANLIKVCRAYREIVARPQGPAEEADARSNPAAGLPSIKDKCKKADQIVQSITG